MTEAIKQPKSAREGLAEYSGDDTEVVRHYADAFVSAAVTEGEAQSAIEDLEAIAGEVLAEHPGLQRVLSSAQVTPADKDRILLSIFGEGVSGVVLRFLRVLNRRGRLGLVSPLAREARQIWDRRHKRIQVGVTTAVPLDEGQQSALAEQVARLISGTPILKYSIDPSLIGGLVVQVGDQVFDSSVRNRLEQVRQRLIEGKTHEIQSRRDQFSHSA